MTRRVALRLGSVPRAALEPPRPAGARDAAAAAVATETATATGTAVATATARIAAQHGAVVVLVRASR